MMPWMSPPGRDRRLYRWVCNAIIVVGVVMVPFLLLGMLPAWVGSALFLFALMWIGVGSVSRSSQRASREVER